MHCFFLGGEKDNYRCLFTLFIYLKKIIKASGHGTADIFTKVDWGITVFFMLYMLRLPRFTTTLDK